MSENGLSNNRLEELRRQREEEKRKKEQEANKQNTTPTSQPTQENNSTQEKVSKNIANASNVKIVSDESVLVENNSSEEDGKVQVGYTMVDSSLVKEAKDNKRYGIKERSDLYKRLNSIVFYVAIPFIILWIIMAFAGICTIKVGYPSFANNIYYTVNNNTAINGYKDGTVLAVKSAGARYAKPGSIVCVEFRDPVTNKKGLHLLKVTRKLGGNGEYVLEVILDNENDAVLNNKNYSTSTPKQLQINDNNPNERYIGIVSGKDIILGKFIIHTQNIIAIVFIVLVPLAIILTFQLINLYDGIKLFKIQKKIAKSTEKKQNKPTEDKDKIVR